MDRSLRVSPPSEGLDEPATGPVSRERMRSRRKRATRGRTISMARVSKAERFREQLLEQLREEEVPVSGIQRPRTRAECINGPRPCPFVSCEHHLYLDVSSNGNLKLNFPDIEPGDLVESCALDVAERGGATLEQVGEIMNLTRERVRQIEVRAFARLQLTHRGGEDARAESDVDAGYVAREPAAEE
jgi:hypothetical protein